MSSYLGNKFSTQANELKKYNSNKFKKSYSLKHRIEESSRIREKYPDRCPVIVQKHYRSENDVPDLDKTKYLVPSDLSVGQLLYVIRKRMKLPCEKALYMFLGSGIMLATSETMVNIYRNHRDDDNFVYFFFNTENTFGN